MEKLIFYAPHIKEELCLPIDEANHCVKVLRKKEGDIILITDGLGYFYDAVITSAHGKHCQVDIVSEIEAPKSWNFNLHVAFAPTKNADRIEWFVEKATETGIDHFTPLLCSNSERKVLKTERLERVMISAIKQSQKASLPALDELIKFNDFIQQPFDGHKFIAHCYDTQRFSLKDVYHQGSNALILIGPEGDFSEQEVEDAVKQGFVPISLTNSRLRTETAALFSCNFLQILNI